MEQRLVLERQGEACDERLADLVARAAIEDEAERAILVVLAYEDDRAVKKRARQLPVVEEQLALE